MDKRRRIMPRIWCSECGTFVVGELMPGISLLDQGYVLSPPHMACKGCERQPAQQDTETPTILRISLEPFCPNCGGGLEMQGDFIWWTTDRADLIDRFVTVDLLCPWCGKGLMTSEVGWRNRETS